MLQEAADRLVDADLRAMVDWAARAMALDVRPLAPSLRSRRWSCRAPSTASRGPRGRRGCGVLPAGRLLSLPDAAHFPHLEDPATVLPALAESLA